MEGIGTARQPRVFFVHIMKTGGWSFHACVLRNLPREEVWAPDPWTDAGDGTEPWELALSVTALADLPVEERCRYRYLTGHVPFAATALAAPPALVATLLRHPVDRTLSYLSQCRRNHPEHHDLPLEEIYEDPWFFPRFVENHQTKVLSMTLDEALTPSPPVALPEGMQPSDLLRVPSALLMADLDPPIGRIVPVDRRRLEVAKRCVEGIDLLGVQEEHAAFLARVAQRTGWSLDPSVRANVGDGLRGGDAPASFRARIAADNALDVELYEHVRDVLATRHLFGP